MANGFVHIELTTDDVKKAQGFYQKLFKWKISAVKGMPYAMINTGTKVPGGGIQQKPMPDAPTAWMPYVEVKDVKRTLAQARKMGAQVPVDYMPMENMGAMGVIVDPTGAAIGVWEPAKKTAKKR